MENLKELKKLKERVESIEITYNYEEVYCDLKNTIIDYMNDTKDWDFENIGEDIIDYDFAEEQAKYELENGGLLRLKCYLSDTNLNCSLFRINGYGNLENVYIEDLQNIKEEILDLINDKLSEEKGLL